MVAVNERWRFLQLCGGIWCATLVGVLYAFAILTHELKASYGISQRQIDTITTIGMVLDFFSFPAGVAYDRFGPRFVNIAATITMATGVSISGLIFGGLIEASFGAFAVAAALTFWPAGWFDVGTLMTNLFNFPNNRGDVIILQKTFMGLGSSILAVCYSAFFRDHYCAYSFFVVGLIVVFGLYGAFVVTLPAHRSSNRRQTTTHNSGGNDETTSLVDNSAEELLSRTYVADKRRLRIGFALLAVTVVFLTSASITNAYTDLSHSTKTAFGVICAVLVLSFPLMALVRFEATSSSSSNSGAAALNDELEHGGEPEEGGAATTVQTLSEIAQNPYTFLENLRRSDLWLLWFCCFGVWGANATIIMNLSQIYRADNEGSYSTSTDSMLVALSGIGSALGRVVVGLIDGAFTARRKSITLLLPVPSIGTVLCVLTFLLLPVDAVIIPFFLSAFSFGFSWAVIVLVARVMFKHDVGKHYDFMYTGGTVALVAFNWGLFGHLYDHVAGNERDGGGHATAGDDGKASCIGKECFQTTFIVLAVTNLICIVAAVVLHRRWVTTYFLSGQ